MPLGGLGQGQGGPPHATLHPGPAWTGAEAEGPVPSGQRASVSLPDAGCGRAGRPLGGRLPDPLPDSWT